MWTREKMIGYLRRRLGNRRLIVVANREPYAHEQSPEGVRWTGPDGGLNSALDPILRATGGTWIAHGSGSADRQTSDDGGRLRVPPGTDAYTLRRIWLNRQEEEGFYHRCCHEGIWPLCHLAHHRPEFHEDAWEEYGRVNEKFAKAVVEEVGNDPCLILSQNYHFALLPRLLRDRLRSAIVAHFWHIPWPSAAALETFPWKRELLGGLLDSDLIFFHLEEHGEAFLDAVQSETGWEVDRTRKEVRQSDRVTRVRAAPISVDFEEISKEAINPGIAEKEAEWRSRLALGSRRVLLSVGRFDYTEGVFERIRAFRRLLETHPEYRNRVVLLEIAIPARGSLSSYSRFRSDAIALVEEVNRAFGTADWQPVVVIAEEQPRSALTALYGLADVCLVTSLHDGMSLVAKEYLAAKPYGRGALILSSRSGAARELSEAILIDPSDVGQIAAGLHYALDLQVVQRERVLRRLRQVVQSRNVFRWAGKLFKEALGTPAAAVAPSTERQFM